MQKILTHFGEMSLKGKNKRAFERQMSANLKRLLKPKKVNRQYGRMLLDMEEVTEEHLELLALIPGVRNFAPVYVAEFDLDSIRAVAKQAVTEAYGNVAGRRFRLRFRVTRWAIDPRAGG
jgi:thiamine biosynthesis protein ThiI